MSARVRSRQGRDRAWRIPRRCETRFAASRRGTRRRLFPRTARRSGAGLRADRRHRGTDGSGDRRGPTAYRGEGSTGPGRGTTPRRAWPGWASARRSSRRRIGTPRRTGSAMSVSITRPCPPRGWRPVFDVRRSFGSHPEHLRAADRRSPGHSRAPAAPSSARLTYVIGPLACGVGACCNIQ